MITTVISVVRADGSSDTRRARDHVELSMHLEQIYQFLQDPRPSVRVQSIMLTPVLR